MLLSDPQIALDEALVACTVSAHRYGYVLSLLQDNRLLPVLESFSKQRSQHALEIESLIRELGFLPRATDPDKETLEQLLSRFKLLLAEDADATLLAEQIAMEEQLIDKLAGALGQPLSAPCLARLSSIKNDVNSAKEQLASLLNRESG